MAKQGSDQEVLRKIRKESGLKKKKDGTWTCKQTVIVIGDAKPTGNDDGVYDFFGFAWQSLATH